MGTGISFEAAERRSRRQEPASVLLAMIVTWLAAAVIFTKLGIQLTDAFGLLRSPDDAMRLVQVHDLLNGQDWFDLTQYRLDPPEGVIMHWSRLIDAPIALLIIGIIQLTDHETAEWITAFIWPLTVLLGLIWVMANLGNRLGGKHALIPSLILPLLSVPLVYEFLPGRLDHHGAQIVLTLSLVLAIQSHDRDWRRALSAGMLAALMLAIGMETVPFVCVAAFLFAGFWVRSGTEAAPALSSFGLGLAGGVTALFFLTISPDRYFTNECDSLSLISVTGAGLAGGASLCLALFSSRLPGIRYRLAASLLAAGGSAAILATLFPNCLAGPYSALDPRLATLWIEGVQEVEGVISIGAREPAQLLQYYLIPAAGLVVAGIAARRCEGAARRDWLILAAFLAVAVLVASLQIRGAKFAIAIAIPAGAWLFSIGGTSEDLGRKRLFYGKYLAALASLLLFTGFLHSLVAQSIAGRGPLPRGVEGKYSGRQNLRACMQRKALSAVNEAPTGLIIAPIDLGAHVLLHTKHSVLGAPYHRDQRGLIDTIDGFNAPLAEAYGRLGERGVTHILYCPGVRLAPANGEVAADALARHLKAGTLPTWLTLVPLRRSTPIRLYRIN